MARQLRGGYPGELIAGGAYFNESLYEVQSLCKDVLRCVVVTDMNRAARRAGPFLNTERDPVFAGHHMPAMAAGLCCVPGWYTDVLFTVQQGFLFQEDEEGSP